MLRAEHAGDGSTWGREVMNAMIDRAVAKDLEGVLALLGEVKLPIEGVVEHFDQFHVAREDGKIAGCVGQERYGDAALLRSLAVLPGEQRGGVGQALTARLLESAQASGVRELVLLTTTARDFFARHFGFEVVERNRFDAAFADSSEWHLPRCSSAVCMHLQLSSE